ncbi:Pnap_2097 family protein [Roseibium sp. HPY-6]|uniref:Pnap_2097 family protein n=1 Tax=Roseibium sp. HPY-6 TaxID=3229852 RepID=UPI00338DB34B
MLDHALGNSSAPPARPQVSWRSSHDLGMPELGYVGLSENWLLKTLGHRHWHLIANAAGQKNATFRNREGNDVYAAFCALSVNTPALWLPDLNDRLDLESTLYRVSRTRLASRHILQVDGTLIGSVCLVSTFVSRRVAGRNASVARVDFPGLPALPALPADLDFPHVAARLAKSGGDRHLGLEGNATTQPTPDLVYEPCPSLDFNRAGLMYFPSFVAAAERAVFKRFGDAAHRFVLSRRDVLFFGNLELHEKLAVQIVDWAEEERFTNAALSATGANGRPVCKLFCRYRKQQSLT